MKIITYTRSPLNNLRIKVCNGCPLQQLKKIVIAIDDLAEEPRPFGVKKLKDSSEELYRIRVGDYRVIYVVDDEIRIVNIRRIGHRKDIYK